MMRIKPTVQIALALVFVTCAMLVLIDSMFQVFPDPDAQIARARTAFAQTVAAEAAALVQRDAKLLEQTLVGIRERNPSVRSLAVRRQDNTLMAQAGEHDKAWGEASAAGSALTHISVPLAAGAERWGSVEVSFVPEQQTLFERVTRQPLWVTLLCVIPLGLFFYWVYMKRALVHLDPTSVIPQRVRLAFNVMTEGVAVLDRQGRILLANDALQALQGGEPFDPVGKALSSLSWLASGLPADASEHPWHCAMREGRSITNHWIELHQASAASRKLVVNCAPIGDDKGKVRGCLATFDDLSELHHANEQLSKTLTELQASQEQIQLKNRELEHLASHDVLTGCLTRRAFYDRMTQAFEHARRQRTPLTCVVLDVDRFKSVNDNFGHAVGDQVVQEVGKQLLASFRASDIVGRCGGDEFYIGMPECDMLAAAAIAESMRQAIERECVARIGIPGLTLSISVGLAALDADDESLADLIERADKALYAAKTAGRNRVAQAGVHQSAAA